MIPFSFRYRTLSILILALSVLTLVTACGTPSLNDGDYVVYSGNATSDGWLAIFRLVVNGEEIDSASFDYINERGELLSEQSAWDERLDAAYGRGPAEAFDRFVETFVENQEFEPSQHTYNSGILNDIARYGQAAVEVAQDGEQGVFELSEDGRTRHDPDSVPNDIGQAIGNYLEEEEDGGTRRRCAVRGGL
ncbi:MAG: hypothetical protein ACOCRN_05795, partial [Spirochaetia bacterium]